ncbi:MULTISPECIES: O-antigen ligase family protein [unclassified Rhizobium]|uniref:O-antigen ligase family protein n=1 Tax=unclassified Rhizobium TaxID=2613769 RepID=UPI00178364C6|nr:MULTISPECIES: O-antigen ligase family protein [unclassified Rhizobium]MBD8688164.1 O-antigen ligase family protein [Rhizobium sp. CFBP 13644]MBD8692619.1 O-antigen ligase family protein [Rhizobium sp. CFBP 13717]
MLKDRQSTGPSAPLEPLSLQRTKDVESAGTQQSKDLLFRVMEVGYWLIICFSLVTYGAVDTTAVAAVTIFAFLYLPVVVVGNRGIPEHIRGLFFLTTLTLATGVAWAHFQALPSYSSAFADLVWNQTGGLLTNDIQRTVSLTPGDAQTGIMKLALPFAVFILTLLLFNNDDRASHGLRMLAFGGGALAIFAVLQFTIAPRSLLFGQKAFYLDSLTAPFVNRNTAATFYGILLLILTALLLKCWRSLDLSRGRVLATIFDLQHSFMVRRTWLIAFLTLVVLTALLLTRSRAGIGAAAIAVSFFLVISALVDTRKRKTAETKAPLNTWMKRSLVAALMLLIVGAVFGTFSGQAVLRAKESGLTDSRFCILPGIMKMLSDTWPMGAGLTSFRDVFPAYRDPACGLGGVFDRAHNVYLEAIVGFGAMGLAMIVTTITVLASVFIHGIRKRRRFRFAGILGLSVLLLVMLHSALDFSLQIPGFAVWFASASGILAALSSLPPNKTRRR